MNQKRRIELRKAISLISQASAIVTKANDEEQDSMDNLPDFQEDRKMTFEDNIEHLEEALDSLSTAISEIGEAMQ